ncbi:CbiX/SirB N-terminal domain-containing protein [Catellatospora sp. KI3]|uniref:sirohydrochlorin chelatase n=1 Tax=Catellatospora sp. KI3 TaxID=3041620 RepID=UPI002482FEAA|nr:CbiX/SirB N-terminal domain-containing protein [Catellatospora sp. KI3]MDI1459783.1 CbiX/SirB N-terminal domain-containing protein [Catellatospora sp. KI3]
MPHELLIHPLAPAGERPPLVLVAHGSRDPRAQASTRALARGVAAARPGLDVRSAFLELAEPSPARVLAALRDSGAAAPVVVPVLLTRAYHGRVDLPAQVAGFDCVIADTLGAVSEPLLAGLVRRLREACPEYDAVVLAAAGTSVASGRATVTGVAAELGRRLGVPCEVAYASAGGPGGAEAVAALRAAGARRVAAAAYFLAPGRLYDTVMSDALQAGAVGAAAPLGAARELVSLVLAAASAVEPQLALTAV